MDIEHPNQGFPNASTLDKSGLNEKNIPSMKNSNGIKYKLISCPLPSFHPSAIQDLAYFESMSLLSVARENNTIEIFNTQTWALRAQIYAQKDSPIKKVLWISFLDQAVLFVAHTNCIISIYDLTSYKPTITKFIGGNAIWDVSVNKKNEIAIACDNGNVQICKMEGYDDLYISKCLRQFNQRALAAEFDLLDDRLIYIGYNNGIIRKHDVKSNEVLVTINLNDDTIPWSLISVPQNQLFIGTNEGKVYICETNFGTIIQILLTHDADILCLKSSLNGSVIYATGLDSKVVSLEFIKSGGSFTSWIISSDVRGQSHDVRCLALLDESTLISGGITSDLCVYKLLNGKFQNSQKRRNLIKNHITSLPLARDLIVVPNKNILIFRQIYSIEFWQIDHSIKEFHFLMEVKSNNSPIVTFDIDLGGKYFSYSNLEKTYVFSLDFNNLVLSKEYQFNNVQLAKFIHNGTKLLTITNDNILSISDLSKLANPNKIIRLIDASQRIYQDIDISIDNRYAAIGSKLDNKIVIVDIKNRDSFLIPNLNGIHHYSCYKFTLKNNLIICYENFDFKEYQLEDERKVSTWNFGDSLTGINKSRKKNVILGVLPHFSDPNRYIMYSKCDVIKIQLSPFVKNGEEVTNTINSDSKIIERLKGDLSIIDQNLKLITLQKYNEDTYINVIFEWKFFANQLPRAVNSKKYGL